MLDYRPTPMPLATNFPPYMVRSPQVNFVSPSLTALGYQIRKNLALWVTPDESKHGDPFLETDCSSMVHTAAAYPPIRKDAPPSPPESNVSCWIR